MDAPLYPPAAAFEQPLGAPVVLQLENASLAELTNVPAAREILFRHLPWLETALQAAWLKPHLGNLTVEALAASRSVAPEELAAINAELARLPPVQESPP